ncbi:hypothetical protein FAEPRAM212_01628 [Faecalibacterium prausnitzii M21/2]|uniref:Uncharacterized protein n=1 Tax=Faecalibacterium prausnitzii M21/2 TaxID=411485 RepID=A8SBC8_9FIRM|nr:hypothetical protein FAEPRAM212_01628 [Faecalibacterium prausnitzii M21/2]
MTQLHLAVIVQVDRRGCADKIHPVLIGDAVDQFILAKGGAHVAVHRVDDLLGKIMVHFVPVHPAVIKILVLLGAGGSTVVGLFCALRGQGSAAAAADILAAQGALPAGGTGAQLRILIRKLPFIACAMGRGVDAQTHLLVTGAVIGCTAVRADHDVVLKGQRLAAALTGTAIIFRHDILL